MDAELKFPVIAHHRVIVDAAAKDLARMRRLFAAFELVEPLAETRVSTGGRYVSCGVSVRLRNRDEMRRFDEQLKCVPGLRMVL